MNHTLFFLIVATTILVNIFWAFLRRKDTNLSTYRADPNKYSWLFVALTLSGTIVGGGMFLAVGQIGYEAGTAGFVLGLVYLTGLIILATLSKQIRLMLARGNHETLIELLRATYSEPVVVLFSIVNLFLYLFLLAGQFVALFQFSQLIQNNTSIIWLPWSLVGLATLSVFLYPIIGGLRKDIQTDVIQMIVVLLGTGVLLWKILSQGVEISIWAELPATHITGTGYGVTFIVGVILFLTPSFLVRMDIWQRIKSSRNDSSAISGFWIAALISCFFYIFFTMIGMWAFASKLPSAKSATLDLIYSQFQDPFALSIIIGAFFAAVLSSADTFINNTSQFLTRIIYPSLWIQRDDDQSRNHLLRRLRISGLIIIATSMLLGYFVPDFVDLLVGAFSLLLIYLPTILGLFVKRWQNSSASLWSSGIALFLFLILFFTWNPKLAFAPAVLASFTTFAIAQQISKPNEKTPSQQNVLQNGA